MRCYDCGKTGEKVYEYPEGRRVIRLCAMCKAEREWRMQPDAGPLPLPPPRKRQSLWERLRSFLGL